MPSGKEGAHLIILHAGAEDGWIPGAALVFRSKCNMGDYHNERNHQTFEGVVYQYPVVKLCS